MGKFDIDSIKAANPLPSVIQRYTGAEIVKNKMRCPFHNDHSPSLHVYDDGGWKCFGCGKHGDVLDFIGYLLHGDNYDSSSHFTDVIDRLGAMDIKPLPAVIQKPKPKPLRTGPGISLEQVMLWSDNQPSFSREYWKSRGLTEQIVREFFLGFDGQRYTIPFLYRYQVLGIKRRQSHIDDGVSAKYTQAKGSVVGLFNADILWTAKEVIICEGEIDAMLLCQHGFPAVSSTGGAGTWKAKWTQLFSQVQSIYIIYDNDEAGLSGALKIRSQIRRAKLLWLPKDVKDVGEFFQQHNSPVTWLSNQMSG